MQQTSFRSCSWFPKSSLRNSESLFAIYFLELVQEIDKYPCLSKKVQNWPPTNAGPADWIQFMSCSNQLPQKCSFKFIVDFVTCNWSCEGFGITTWSVNWSFELDPQCWSGVLPQGSHMNTYWSLLTYRAYPLLSVPNSPAISVPQ